MIFNSGNSSNVLSGIAVRCTPPAMITVLGIFSLINLASNPGKLKKSLIFIGFLIIVIGIAYASSTGVETPMKDGQVLSASGSKWVGTGIRVFYILASVAVLSMIAFGARNIIKK